MNEKMNAGIGRFRQKVLAFMRKNHMTDRGDGVLAAVSGGADSVCLLLLLCGAQFACFCVNWQQNLGSMSLHSI